MLRACQLLLEVLLQLLAPVERFAVAQGFEGAAANWVTGKLATGDC